MKLSLLSILILCLACQTAQQKESQEFSYDNIKKLKVGVSRTDEVITLIGSPYKKFIEKDGTEAWDYWLANEKRESDPKLVISVNQRTKVIKEIYFRVDDSDKNVSLNLLETNSSAHLKYTPQNWEADAGPFDDLYQDKTKGISAYFHPAWNRLTYIYFQTPSIENAVSSNK